MHILSEREERMAYLRGDYYIWGDGENIHIGVKEEAVGGAEGGPEYGYGGVYLPYDVLDEYVVMRFAELLHEARIEPTIERAMRRGNFGGVILEENVEEIRQAVSRVKIKPPQKPRSF